MKTICSGRDGDRISDLPEAIITEILNLVPTKDAVGTSLLSKSWRHRWKGVATFDLASSAPKSGVTVLPSEIYCYKTLKVLKLDGCFWVRLDSVCLPKLTELALNWVEYTSSASVGKLISSCPVLQSLTIKKRLFYRHDSVFTVSSLSLKRLHICFINDETCGIKRTGMKLRVDAPALEYLVLHDLVSVDISIASCSAKEADIDVRRPGVAVGLLDTLSAGVEFLKLSYKTMKALKTATYGDFERLTKLVVNCCDLRCLVDLMDRCVNLQVLEIDGCWTPRQLCDLQGRYPRCLSSSLRQATVKLSGAATEDLKLIDLILSHGLVMETVTLCFRDGAGKSCVWETLPWVLGMHKASPTCKIFRRMGDLGALQLIGYSILESVITNALVRSCFASLLGGEFLF